MLQSHPPFLTNLKLILLADAQELLRLTEKATK